MADGNILMGVVGKPHGVRGLLRVHSFTADPADLPDYAPLVDERGRVWTVTWRGDGLAELRDAAGRAVADRTEAGKLVNLRLFAPRERLPPVADADEFYLADLIGLLAVDGEGSSLGQVAAVHDYGAGTSLEIARGGDSFFVPFTRVAVPVVDVPGGQVTIVLPDEVEVQGDVSGDARVSGERDISGERDDSGERPVSDERDAAGGRNVSGAHRAAAHAA